MDFSENQCYLGVVRPPLKSIKHCVTGECQIERVCAQNDHQALQFSIKHSKMLMEYKEKYTFDRPFHPKQAEALCGQKNITDDQSKFYVVRMLKELHSYKFCLNFLTKLLQTKYDKQNKKHEEMLLQLWKNFKPNSTLQKRITDQWIDLGFQGNDPSTDFRGAGYLGLINLHRISQTKLGKNLFQTASNSKTQYFFCSAGLSFTMLSFQLLRNNQLEMNYWVSASEEQAIIQFQNLYQMIFHKFDKFWHSCSDKSIMEFNVNLKKFQRKILQKSSKKLAIDIQKTMEI